jgi:ABC-type phosphate transport system substrate-binding protein
MLRPIGSLPTSVYWRRRLLIVAAVLLAALTVYVVFMSGDNKKTSAQPTGGAPSTHAPSSTSPTPAGTSVAPVSCVPSVLKVAAVTQAGGYRVGQQPELAIEVTNTGTAPCIANLSDSQIELIVFNGASRVWGSHDCQVEPGTSPVTLMAHKPVRRSIQWTGLSSRPECAGSRQRVGAGVYTLRVHLGKMESADAKFTIKP